jgi:predicted NUDIX family phosphoesterase
MAEWRSRLLQPGQQTILAVESAKLLVGEEGSRFHMCTITSLLTALESAGLWIGPRSALEDNDSFRQVIPYIVLRERDQIVSYARTPAGTETRLHGRRSFGLGGHIDLQDVAVRSGAIDLLRTLENAASREVEEEIGPVRVFQRDWVGLIVENSTSVDRVHVGVVGVWDIDVIGGNSHEEAIGNAKLIPVTRLKNVRDELENWSAILLPFLEGILPRDGYHLSCRN